MGTGNLQNLVERYKREGVGLDSIFDHVARLLYADPVRYGFDSEDDAAEVVFRFRNRIRNLPVRYVDSGSTFEAYLSTCLRYYARTMRRETRRRRERESLCERAEALDLELGGFLDANARWHPSVHAAATTVAEDGEPYEPGARTGIRRGTSSEKAAFRDRLVFLYLKCAWNSDDGKTDLVARTADVDPGWLAAALSQALRSLEPERTRYERLVLKRDRSWGRMRLLEGRLHEEADPSGRQDLGRKLERERRRLGKARAEIKAFRPVVSNSMVARILGVPKGTVDCGLYMLKKRAGS